MTRIFKRLAMLALLATLAFPTSAFAADVTGTVNESGISVPATISATIPASCTYEVLVAQPTYWTCIIPVTALTTNNPSGLTVTASVDPYTNGVQTLPTTLRSTSNNDVLGGVTAGSAVAKGAWLNSSTVKTLGSTNFATGGTAGSFNSYMRVLIADVTIPGSWTSATRITVSTNP